MRVGPLREEQAIQQVIDRLTAEYADSRPGAEVADLVASAQARFDGHRVRDFVPIFVENIARRELAEPAEETQVNTEENPGDLEKETAERRLPDSPSPRRIRIPRSVAKPLIAVLAALGVAGAAVVVYVSTQDEEPAKLTLIRGVVGSEKQAFFNDPQVKDALAKQGIEVKVEPAGSRQIATSIDLGKFDFAFPSSAPAADRIQRQRGVNTEYTPFSSPMAIATFQPIADLLAKEGIVRRGATWTFNVGRYLDLVAARTQWKDLEGNRTYPVRRNILVSTTDPRTSNSAAMYLAITGYVANRNSVVQGPDAERRVLPTLSPLFLGQGYTDNTTEGPFEDYLSIGMGKAPLVCIYEAQYVGAAIRGQTKPGMVMMYPSPTVLSKHTLVPFNPSGDRVGRLLSTDPTLQRLAARHGFRTRDPQQFAQVATESKVRVSSNLIDVVDTPSYETLENLLNGIAKQYGRA
ncbi:three-helix bundle dimerization domain-containing protein [Spirillospora sp. CA-255316]